MGKSRRALVLGAAVASFANLGYAQFGGGAAGGGRRGRSAEQAPGAHATEQPLSREARASQIRELLYDLRVRLAITPEQSSLWDRFDAKAWAWALGKSSARQVDPDGLTAVQAIDRKVDAYKSDANRMDEVGEAVRKLYASLTEEQRQVADHFLPLTVL